jgi:hypothetical protein
MIQANQTSTHEQTFQKDFQRCEVTTLDQRVRQLTAHLLADVVPLRGSCEKENP